MRKNPTNQASIIELLEKCQRNLKGVELRTLSQDGSIDPVKFSNDEYKHVIKLLNKVQELSSLMEERFIPPVQREKKHPIKKEKEKLSPLQEYMRKHK